MDAVVIFLLLLLPLHHPCCHYHHLCYPSVSYSVCIQGICVYIFTRRLGACTVCPSVFTSPVSLTHRNHRPLRKPPPTHFLICSVTGSVCVCVYVYAYLCYSSCCDINVWERVPHNCLCIKTSGIG